MVIVYVVLRYNQSVEKRNRLIYIKVIKDNVDMTYSIEYKFSF